MSAFDYSHLLYCNPSSGRRALETFLDAPKVLFILSVHHSWLISWTKVRFITLVHLGLHNIVWNKQYNLCCMNRFSWVGIYNLATCIHFLKVSISFSSPPITVANREISGGLDPAAVIPQYRRGGCPGPSNLPECSNSHELETLMPSGSQESAQLPSEAPEEQSLMASANPGEGEDAPAPESKVKTCMGGKLISSWVLDMLSVIYFFFFTCW